ncbi:MAG: LysR family transcriptional regulator [Peptococcaceae bacterium]|nr:LysR family transcriptional regulator [Peptococcaceae bacterium]MBQ2859870.1 LysR family transcriptional regulator [Peptococcaceae bacterium]
MRIEQLEYLAAIHKYHSMSLAGKKIHISQQAISTAIKQLEEEFGMKFVHKTKQGSLLSPEGIRLLQISQRFFAECEDLKNSKVEDNLPTELVFVTPDNSDEIIWNELFYHFYNHYPQIKLKQKRFKDHHVSLKEYLLQHPHYIGLTFLLPNDLVDFGNQINYYCLSNNRFYFLSTNPNDCNLKTISLNSIKNRNILLNCNEDEYPFVRRALQGCSRFWSANRVNFQVSSELFVPLLANDPNCCCLIPWDNASEKKLFQNLQTAIRKLSPNVQLNIIPILENIELTFVLCSASKIPKILLDYFHITV